MKKKKKTVLFLTVSSQNIGPLKNIIFYIKSLNTNKYNKCMVFCNNVVENKYIKELRRLDVDITSLQMSSAFDILAIAKLRRYVIKHKVDIIVSRLVRADFINSIVSLSIGSIYSIYSWYYVTNRRRSFGSPQTFWRRNCTNEQNYILFCHCYFSAY